MCQRAAPSYIFKPPQGRATYPWFFTQHDPPRRCCIIHHLPDTRREGHRCSFHLPTRKRQAFEAPPRVNSAECQARRHLTLPLKYITEIYVSECTAALTGPDCLCTDTSAAGIEEVVVMTRPEEAPVFSQPDNLLWGVTEARLLSFPRLLSPWRNRIPREPQGEMSYVLRQIKV